MHLRHAVDSLMRVDAFLQYEVGVDLAALPDRVRDRMQVLNPPFLLEAESALETLSAMCLPTDVLDALLAFRRQFPSAQAWIHGTYPLH